MKLLYVCSDFGIPPSGTKGASIHLRAITRALIEAGVDVQLLSPLDGPDGDHPVHRLLPPGCPPAKQTVKLLKRWMRGCGLNDALARELRPLLYNAWAPEKALEAMADSPPDAILERLSLLGHVGLDLADALNVPLIVEVNALLTEEARAYRSLQLSDLAETIERRVLDRADALIAVSSPIADRLAARGVKPERIHVVPNGVDVAAYARSPDGEACRSALGFDDAFVIGFVGSLKPWHGVDVLLRAAAGLRQTDASVRVLVVGAGPELASLRPLADELGLGDKVTFTGAVDHHRIPEMLSAMDVAVAPFHDVEGFYFSPIKLFEYMAAGLCVIASNLGQIAEVVTDGVNGLLCAPGDEHALQTAVQRVRQAPEVRRRLGEAAAETVRRKYTWAHAARAVSTIIESAIEGGPFDSEAISVGAGQSAAAMED